MNTETINMDFGLLYLSNFEEGLNYYQWDRKIIYDLKSKVSPGVMMANLKERGLAKEAIKENTKYYVLTESGKKYCKSSLSKFENVFSVINDHISELMNKGYLIDQIRNDLPIISFFFSKRKYKLIMENAEGETYVKVFLPNDLKDATNEIKISTRGIENSDFLKEILIANFNLFSKVNL